MHVAWFEKKRVLNSIFKRFYAYLQYVIIGDCGLQVSRLGATAKGSCVDLGVES